MSTAMALNQNLMNNNPQKYQGLDTTSIRTIEEVKGAITVAKLFPRDENLAVDKILRSCKRSTLAESALYEFSRGGTPIEGPSIRLAEAVAINWGNIQYGVRAIDEKDDETTYEAYAWDMENNVRTSRIFTVEHVRFTKRAGKQKVEDPRDVYEIVMSQAARRLRSCILEIIPGDVIDAAVEACKQTLIVNAGNVDKGERIKKMLAVFANWKVTQKMIEKKYNCNAEALSEGHLVKLRATAQSIKDGYSKPEDNFEFETANEGTNKGNASSLNDQLGE